MCQAIIHVLQASMDAVEQQSGHSFELFGADFMLSTDLRPWLIEVNSSPSMAYSTHVTKTLCRQVQEDVLKGELLPSLHL
jgi:tubulin monoglycylase TTLL3/8